MEKEIQGIRRTLLDLRFMIIRSNTCLNLKSDFISSYGMSGYHDQMWFCSDPFHIIFVEPTYWTMGFASLRILWWPIHHCLLTSICRAGDTEGPQISFIFNEDIDFFKEFIIQISYSNLHLFSICLKLS